MTTAMPASPAAELRDLHDTYTWELNAALGRGEDRIVERLQAEYADRALALIVAREAR